MFLFLAMLMVATTWLLSVTHNLSGSMPYVYIAGGLCKMGIYNSKSVKLANGIVGFCLIYLIPITILIYCYGRMAYALTTKVSFVFTFLLLYVFKLCCFILKHLYIDKCLRLKYAVKK